MSDPLVLSLRMGVDSTAVLVGWHELGIRPDAIVFSDPGSEHPETYAYRPGGVPSSALLQTGPLTRDERDRSIGASAPDVAEYGQIFFWWRA